MTTPTKEQIEKVAFELFNADFCAMTEADWDWRPERIKSQYRAMAQVAIIEWEKIKGDEVLSWLEKEYGYAKGRLLDSSKKANVETEQKMLLALHCLISTRKNQK